MFQLAFPFLKLLKCSKPRKDYDHGLKFVLMCQVLEENQQHIVNQNNFDWTFPNWDKKLRNCLVRRAFCHENKKVICSLYRSIMEGIQARF